MFHSVNVPYYHHDFVTSDANCKDISIGGACGAYSYYYYHYYIFLFNLNRLFQCDYIAKADWIGSRRILLNKLGLDMRAWDVHTEEDFMAIVRNCIDQKSPVFILIKYCCLYYWSSYLTDTKLTHGTIITDYDDDKKLMVIRDNFATREMTDSVMAGHPFSKVYLKSEWLWGMWNSSNELLVNENSFGMNKVFEIIKISNEQISSKQILMHFLEIDPINDQSLKYIDEYNLMSLPWCTDDMVKMFRQIYCSMRALLNIILVILKMESPILADEWEPFMKKNDKLRNDVYLHLYKSSQRKEKITSQQKSEFRDMLLSANHDVYRTVSNIVLRL